MSNTFSANDALHFPSRNQKYHDLTMLYIEKTFDFSNASPKDLLENYNQVFSELKSFDTKPKL